MTLELTPLDYRPVLALIAGGMSPEDAGRMCGLTLEEVDAAIAKDLRPAIGPFRMVRYDDVPLSEVRLEMALRSAVGTGSGDDL